MGNTHCCPDSCQPLTRWHAGVGSDVQIAAAPGACQPCEQGFTESDKSKHLKTYSGSLLPDMQRTAIFTGMIQDGIPLKMLKLFAMTSSCIITSVLSDSPWPAESWHKFAENIWAIPAQFRPILQLSCQELKGNVRNVQLVEHVEEHRQTSIHEKPL